MEEKLNILFTSVGRRSYLIKYFKEALNGQGEVHAANSSDLSTAFQVADKSIVTPLIYDKNYIPFLLEYCKNNNIKAILSLFDVDLPILSKNKELFLQIGVEVIVSDSYVVDICNDKLKTYKFLCKNGIETPKTFINLDDAYSALYQNLIKYPVILKPRWGMGSIAVYQADNAQELEIFYNKVRKNVFDTYLKYESESDLKRCVLIQEKLLCQEYGLDVINDLKGNYINTVVKMKYAMRSGETDCAVTVDNSSAKLLGKKLSSCLKHIANLDVDIFINGDKIYVLDMNARFGGGYPFSHAAGINLPKAIVKWLKNEKTDMSILTEHIGVTSQKDIRMVKLNHILSDEKL